MKKTFTLMLCISIFSSLLIAQTNLIQNPGFEATSSTFTVPVGTPAVNYLYKVASNSATKTDITQPIAPTSIAITDGLWVKRQTVPSSSLQAYLSPGGANGSATFLFLKIAGANGTMGFDWTQMSAQQRLSLSNNIVYTFSFWAKVGNAVNTVYAYIADKNGDTGSASFTKSIPLTGGSTWTKYTVTFDIPAERAAKLSLDYSTAYIGVGINALYNTATPPVTLNNWLYLDDFELLVKKECLVPIIRSTTPDNIYIKTNSIPVTITFNADVAEFTLSDLVVTNGTLNNFTVVDAKTYTVNIVPTTTGKVTLDILAGAAVDANTRQSIASNQFVRLVNCEVPTGDYTNFTTICAAKDNKPAVYTFTFDDASTVSGIFFNNEFKRLNLVGSLGFAANWITSTWGFWNGILADGRFDIFNHSKSHISFSTITNTQAGKDSLYNEIIGNQIIFRNKFPGQDIITMANPLVVNTDAADVLIKQSHYAARNGGSGYNSLSPTDTEWFRLKMSVNYFASLSRPAYSTEMNKYIDNTIANKQWLILLAHGVGTAINLMPDTAFTKHFEYVASKRADLWIGSFADVTRYFREKQNATIITLDSTATRIAISVTHNLDANIFKFPLTLKTKVPATWTTVNVMQGLTSKNIESVVENGMSYIYYDAVPNGGTVALTSAVNSAVYQNSDFQNNSKVYFQSTNNELILKNVHAENATVKIYNSVGVLVKTQRIQKISDSIKLENLTAGNYLAISSFSNGESISTKFFKK